MRLTKFGHSCLLVEEERTRILLDPGTLSDGFQELQGLTAVLHTHQHADHLDPARLRGLLDRNPGVRFVSDEGSDKVLGEAGAELDLEDAQAQPDQLSNLKSEDALFAFRFLLY